MGKGLHESVRTHGLVHQPVYRGMAHKAGRVADGVGASVDMYKKEPAKHWVVEGKKAQLHVVYAMKKPVVSTVLASGKADVATVQRSVINQAQKEMRKAIQKAQGSGVLKVGFIPHTQAQKFLEVQCPHKGFKARLDVSSMRMEITFLSGGEIVYVDMNRKGPWADFMG
jgi:hypothetical protein